MEFKVGDYVEGLPGNPGNYYITTNYYIGKITEVGSSTFKAKTIRNSDISYYDEYYGGEIICGLKPKYFRKVSEFKLALIRSKGHLNES